MGGNPELVRAMHPNSLANLVPGNRGGGRKPDELRKLARTDLESWLAILRTKAALVQDPAYDNDASIGEAAKALDVLAKYGLGPKEWSLDESAQLQAVGQATADYFASIGQPERFDEWVRHVEDHVKSL